MNLWLKLLLSFTYSLCCIGGCLGFNVSAAAVADAWQSSWYRGDGCFRSSSARPGHWNYFHSSGTPDPSGYQWLLLKLTRCVRVRSVTVYGVMRPEAPAAERVRALGIEVLLSDRKPAGLTENPPACTATFNHSLTGFRPCGVTKDSGSSELAHEVTCSVRDYSKLTQFVLLRKFVANETDKFVNFRLLEIEEDEEDEALNRISNYIHEPGERNESACYKAYFCRQWKSKCSVRELSHLNENGKLMVRAWLACRLTETAAPNCSIRMRNGDVMALSIKVKTPSFLILSEFSVTSEMDGATLQCRHSCSDGAHGETSQVLAMQVCASVTPTSASLNLSVTQHWVVGQTAVFSFSTEGSAGLPEHKCYLKYYPKQPDDSGRNERLDLKELSSSNSSKQMNSSSGFDLETFFEVLLLSAHPNAEISCGIECNSHKIASVSERIPQLLEPCSTRFLLPPNSSWIDGAAVNLTADSSEGNWVATSHICFLQSAGVPNSTLRIVSSTNSSSTFSVPVSRHWGSSASVACLVNQSGLIETWARHPLPPVLYPVQNASIRPAAPQIRANWSAPILLLASDTGNPPAEHSCSVAGRNLTQLMPPSNLNASSLWTLNALADDDGQKIDCEIIQRTQDNGILFNKSISSGKLDVIYKPNNSWTATQPLVMREGEPLSVTVTSVGGNPPPSHRCWLQTADHHNISMTQDPSDTQAGQMDGRQKLLETKFSANSTRQLNGGSVMCSSSQEGFADLESLFRQNITVFYRVQKASVNLTQGQIRNGSEVRVALLASGLGNPPAQHFCRIAGRNLSQKQQPSESNASSVWTFHALASDNGMRIRCQLMQVATNGSTVFNLSVSSDSISVIYASTSTWNAKQSLVTEGELLSVAVTSVGGNPEPSHECWLQATEGHNVSMTEINVTSEKDRHQKKLKTKFGANLTRRINEGAVRCRVSQNGLADLVSNFRQSITVFFHTGPPEIVGLPASVYEGVNVTFSVRSGDGNPSVNHSCAVNHHTIKILPKYSSAKGFESRMSFTPKRTQNRVHCSAVQIHGTETVFNISSIANFTVYYKANNTQLVSISSPITEGSDLNITLVSVGGRPAVRDLSCWIGDIRLSACDNSAVSKSAGRFEQRYSIRTSRVHNEKSLSCKFDQDEILTEWKNRSLSVYFPSNSISWFGQLLGGAHLNLTLQTEEGNPRPELHCSLRSETVSIGRLTLIPEPDLRGSYGGWVRRARLSYRFTEQQPEVTVTCLISQTPFPPAENTKTLRAVFPSARGSSSSFGSGALIIAAICCSLAAAAALCFAATKAALKWRTRAAATARRCETVELPTTVEKPTDPNAVYYYAEH